MGDSSESNPQDGDNLVTSIVEFSLSALSHGFTSLAYITYILILTVVVFTVFFRFENTMIASFVTVISVLIARYLMRRVEKSYNSTSKDNRESVME